MQDKTYARFSASRWRSMAVAPIATVLAVGFAPRDLDLDRYGAFSVVADVFFLLCLAAAVRAWIVVLRGRDGLWLTADGVRLKRAKRELSVPWDAVGLVRIDWKSKTPWVVLRLADAVPSDQVPVRAEPDGSYRVLPLGHGRSMKSRMKQIGKFRVAGMTYGGRYVNVTSPAQSG